jgi:osmotically-inducible protein OsmY
MENSDRHIIAQVEGVLSQDPRVRLHNSKILIGSEGGYVTLSGEVPTVAAKRVAIRLAGGAGGVKSVHDELRVETPNPMGDLEIAEHIRRSFVAERNIEEAQIDIETDTRGGVILRGTVRSLIQVRLCEVLCWWVRGVTEVRNLLVVNPPEEDNDEELKDNLITIMEKDFLVDPKKFRIEVSRGVVTLRGQVGSEIEKDAAEKDCWYTPGVSDVVNKLQIG